MNHLRKRTDDESQNSANVKTYHVELKPRSLLGRTVLGVLAGAIVIASFVFLSVFLAIGFALLALAIVVGLIRQLASNNPQSEHADTPSVRAEANRTSATTIDVEQSPEDGVYRPRD